MVHPHLFAEEILACSTANSKPGADKRKNTSGKNAASPNKGQKHNSEPLPTLHIQWAPGPLPLFETHEEGQASPSQAGPPSTAQGTDQSHHPDEVTAPWELYPIPLHSRRRTPLLSANVLRLTVSLSGILSTLGL